MKVRGAGNCKAFNSAGSVSRADDKMEWNVCNKRTVTPKLRFVFAACLIASLLPSAVHSQVELQNLFDSLFSQATFLEQCTANGIIPPTNVHNENILKAQALGFPVTDFWNAAQNGAQGEVYDLFRETWVSAPFDRVNCEFVEAEQRKFQKSLARY